MPNEFCQCPAAGWCARHQMHKTPHQHLMCKGEAPTSDRGWKYFVAWEKGMLGATPPENPQVNCPPFAKGSYSVVVHVPQNPASIVENGLKKTCGGCGGTKTWEEVVEKAVLDGSGPGTELLRMYHDAGVPRCPACIAMAAQMNKWGVDGCREKIEAITDDILPRAKIWMSENHPFIHRLLPSVVEDAGIRIKIKHDVQKAISTAESK